MDVGCDCAGLSVSDGPTELSPSWTGLGWAGISSVLETLHVDRLGWRLLANPMEGLRRAEEEAPLALNVSQEVQRSHKIRAARLPFAVALNLGVDLFAIYCDILSIDPCAWSCSCSLRGAKAWECLKNILSLTDFPKFSPKKSLSQQGYLLRLGY